MWSWFQYYNFLLLKLFSGFNWVFKLYYQSNRYKNGKWNLKVHSDNNLPCKACRQWLWQIFGTVSVGLVYDWQNHHKYLHCQGGRCKGCFSEGIWQQCKALCRSCLICYWWPAINKIKRFVNIRRTTYYAILSNKLVHLKR